MTFQIFINMVKEWVLAQAYATEAWVLAKVYATEAWVLAQGYTTLANVLDEIQGTRMDAYRTTATQTIPTGTYTKVELNFDLFDTKHEFFAGTHRWVCTTTGYYDVSYGVGYRAGIPATKRIKCCLYINGSKKTEQINTSAANVWFTVAGSRLCHFTEGQFVELWTWHDAGVGANLDYTNEFCFLSIHRLP